MSVSKDDSKNLPETGTDNVESDHKLCPKVSDKQFKAAPLDGGYGWVVLAAVFYISVSHSKVGNKSISNGGTKIV